MCGIAGIVNFKEKEDKSDLLVRMIGFLQHRGPDAAGIYARGPAGLGHARLSIIDLAGGDQPIHNEDRSIWIVYNGEVFNYPELRRELEAAGHRFYTQTDTEVLVHLYESHGPRMFDMLNGQFALALWDEKEEKLVLARDRVGIRPLFYTATPGRLLFASEIKALFADRTTPRRLDPHTLADIFISWAPTGRRTPFDQIRQIPPGHYATFTKSGFSVSAYWDLRPTEAQAAERPLEAWVEELRGLLLDATRIRLRADVPVGAYLSGGIDSTYTSAVVKRHFNNRLCTFSVAFENQAFDETPYQQMAVDNLETEHRRIRCTESDIGEAFPDVIWHSETPMLRTAPTPLFLLSRLVGETNFKVVLTGEGADEIFAGYNIFKETMVRRFWARQPESSLRPQLLERLYPFIFNGANEKAKRYLQAFFRKRLGEVDSQVYSHLLRWHNTSRLQRFLNPEILTDDETLAPFIRRFTESLPQGFDLWPPLSRAQYIEMKIFLSNYLLSTQGDRMAMAHSVEGRYPFLDHRVIDLAFSMPARYRLNGLTEKFVLKKAARGIVPEAIITRAKQPYRAPISSVFTGPHRPDYVNDLLSEKHIGQSGYFSVPRVAALLKKCRNSPVERISEREDMAVVGILSTQMLDHQFVRHFPDQPQRPPTNLTVAITEN